MKSEQIQCPRCQKEYTKFECQVVDVCLECLVNGEKEDLVKQYGDVMECGNCGDYMVPKKIEYAIDHQEQVLTLVNFPVFECINQDCEESIFSLSELQGHLERAVSRFEETGKKYYDCEEA